MATGAITSSVHFKELIFAVTLWFEKIMFYSLSCVECADYSYNWMKYVEAAF